MTEATNELRDLRKWAAYADGLVEACCCNPPPGHERREAVELAAYILYAAADVLKCLDALEHNVFPPAFSPDHKVDRLEWIRSAGNLSRDPEAFSEGLAKLDDEMEKSAETLAGDQGA